MDIDTETKMCYNYLFEDDYNGQTPIRMGETVGRLFYKRKKEYKKWLKVRIGAKKKYKY